MSRGFRRRHKPGIWKGFDLVSACLPLRLCHYQQSPREVACHWSRSRWGFSSHSALSPRPWTRKIRNPWVSRYRGQQEFCNGEFVRHEESRHEERLLKHCANLKICVSSPHYDVLRLAPLTETIRLVRPPRISREFALLRRRTGCCPLQKKRSWR